MSYVNTVVRAARSLHTSRRHVHETLLSYLCLALTPSGRFVRYDEAPSAYKDILSHLYTRG